MDPDIVQLRKLLKEYRQRLCEVENKLAKIIEQVRTKEALDKLTRS